MHNAAEWLVYTGVRDVCSLYFLVVLDKNLKFPNLCKLHGICERSYIIIKNPVHWHCISSEAVE